jgi:ribosomal 50S subunit-recycling heat shock protein
MASQTIHPNQKIEYSFVTNVTKKVTKEEKRVENGEEITVKKEVDEIQPVKIIFMRPTRKQREEADMVYSKHLFWCMEQGLMTKQQIAKTYNDKGGDLSKPEIDLYVKLNKELADAVREAETFASKDPSTLTEEERKRNFQVLADVSLIKRELIDFETQRAAIFDATADQKAFYKALSWYTVFLTYKEVEGKISPLFQGETFDDKLDTYDRLLDDEDELITNIRSKLSSIIAYWFTANPKTKADWVPIEDEIGIENIES